MADADGRTNELKAEAAVAATAATALEADLAEKAADMAAVATEKELQAGGEVKELAAQAEQLSKQCVPATSVSSTCDRTSYGEIRRRGGWAGDAYTRVNGQCYLVLERGDNVIFRDIGTSELQLCSKHAYF